MYHMSAASHSKYAERLPFHHPTKTDNCLSFAFFYVKHCLVSVSATLLHETNVFYILIMNTQWQHLKTLHYK